LEKLSKIKNQSYKLSSEVWKQGF